MTERSTVPRRLGVGAGVVLALGLLGALLLAGGGESSRSAAGVTTTAPAAAPRPGTSTDPAKAVAAAWLAAGAKRVAVEAAPAPLAGEDAPPVRIEIPAIGVSAPVDPLGLDPDGTLQVPDDYSHAGYYSGRPLPGAAGPAVIVGHVDSRRAPAVFFRLRQLRPGDKVAVHRADGTWVVFVVARSRQVPKDAFPTEEVYGPTPERTLRLITCGGSFDRSSGHYRDNLIVFLEELK